ncbi:Two-component signal transduction system YycFG, regulatory protein YycI [Psychrobacillus sp. OK028]|uniref:two-component system regulatory protein YycI n=1 Tax=Psychrobacillus sp. OK028 TaxID=1884359 RepID=UPI000880C007|nr:two-component system regulatory protein YycI [Psychrobacillus sp. OK028]SDN85912.1 Two-component signal transduction system YycFG, regulatory protein YycI [Psychrobacillus sp. OK028]
MDWSKTKTIFIIVFSILNVFLLSLYLNRYNASQQIDKPNDTPIEEKLILDNIKVLATNDEIKEASYVSGTVHNFNQEEIEELSNQTIEIAAKDKIISTFDEPIKITDENTLEKIVHEQVINGAAYSLWKIDEENNTAILFQQVNKRLVYYNSNAKLLVRWNEENELIGYEQTILDDLENFNMSQKLLPHMQVINKLYDNSLLKPDSMIKEIKLGYSTLAQLTETQVFAPTWHILVELLDGTIEEYFVNAVEGRVVDIQTEKEQTAVE